jgi:hypothetical protein
MLYRNAVSLELILQQPSKKGTLIVSILEEETEAWGWGCPLYKH